MTPATTELAQLCRAVKAPAAALLKTDQPRRQGRLKAARFPARKTLEEFDFAFQTSLRRAQGSCQCSPQHAIPVPTRLTSRPLRSVGMLTLTRPDRPAVRDARLLCGRPPAAGC